MEFTTQQLKALDLNRNLIVTAGAGSGKTTILVERYLNILVKIPDTSVYDILAITFTDKAASEMKQRIVDRIYDFFDKKPALRERILEIIKSVSATQISTIHSFCNSLIREYAIYARFNPDSRVADPPEIESLLDRIFWDYFYNFFPSKSENTDLQIIALREYEVVKIQSLFKEVYSRRAILYPFLKKYVYITPDEISKQWNDVEINYYRKLFSKFWMDSIATESLRNLKGGLKRIGNKTANDLIEKIEQYLHVSSELISLRTEISISLLKSIFKNDGGLRQQHLTNLEKCSEAARQSFNYLTNLFQPLFTKIIMDNGDKGENEHYVNVLCGMSRLFYELLQKVEEEKERRQILDFDDQLIEALRLLEEHPDTLESLRKKYKWILVDEFQDTDVIQSKIVEMIAGEENSLFLVGDPKQSIYSFRQADVSIFMEVLGKIHHQNTKNIEFVNPETNQKIESNQIERNGVIELPDNFRSTHFLVEFYNAFFDNLFSIESDYDVEFSPLVPSRKVVPNHTSEAKFNFFHCESPLNQEEYIPHEIGMILQIIDSVVNTNHYSKSDSTGKLASISYGDIAILTRDRRKWDQLSTALQFANIPYAIHKGIGFYQTQEVQDIYYLLKTIADPEDNFAFISSLRSAYIGVSDIGLFYLSRCNGKNYSEKLYQMKTFIEEEFPDNYFEDNFLKIVKQQKLGINLSADDKAALLNAANLFPRWEISLHRGEYGLILNDILETLNVPAILKKERFGEQKIANLNKLVRFIYEYEQSSSGGITDFLNTFSGLIEGTLKEGEATVKTEAGNQVKIMTIHSAKGLEFPVVILPFLESQIKDRETIYFNKTDGILFPLNKNSNKNKSFIYNYFFEINRQKILAEEKRLLYVAATRAMDYLFFMGTSGVSREARDSYLQWLSDILENNPDIILNGDMRNSNNFGLSVQKISISAGTQKTNFEKITSPMPQEKKVFDKIIDNKTISKYSKELERVLPNGEYSATQLMIFEEDPNRYFKHFFLKNASIYPPNLLEEYTDDPGGLWWGTLVHKSLEDFHFRNISQDSIIADKLLNQFRIPPSEHSGLKKDLLYLLTRFRGTEMGKHLISTEQKSEVRVEMQFKRGSLIGIFDRLYKNQEGNWEVLDFKTNRIHKTQLPGLHKKYFAQMRYYSLLLSRLFPKQNGFPVRLFFLNVMSDYRVDFEEIQIKEVHFQTEELIQKIWKYEAKYFLQ
jgi:ATP-dependent exoDNAse (exonuclease V) beta subunit